MLAILWNIRRNLDYDDDYYNNAYHDDSDDALCKGITDNEDNTEYDHIV